MTDFEQGEALESETQLAELRRSLLESTYSSPVTARLVLADGGVNLNVLVVALRAKYVEFSTGGSEAMGCWDRPEWEFDAWLVRPVSDPVSGQLLLRIRISTNGDGSFDVGTVTAAPGNAI